MKLEKLSNIALYSCIGLGVVCFLLFFLVDYNNMDFDGVHVSPALTDLVLILMYLLFFVAAGLTIWSLVRSATVNSGNTGPSPTGIAGGKVALCTWGTVIATLVIGVLFGLGEEPYTTNSGVTTSAGMVTVVDMWLWAIYILAVVAIVAVVVSMSGYLTKSATPKE
ncbi:MAG: hypothetical protein IKO85_07315 [Bacteroidaceae bacterium]|jgi:hypothetical protein|nr:hypothetical protein [Bacteroidaceae bacterium]